MSARTSHTEAQDCAVVLIVAVCMTLWMLWVSFWSFLCLCVVVLHGVAANCIPFCFFSS